MDRPRRAAVTAGDRRDVDDHAAALFKHFGNDGLCRKKGAGRVKVHDLVPTGFCKVERLEAFDERTSVIYEDIDGAEAVLDFADHACDLAVFRNVDLEGYRFRCSIRC